MAGLAVPSFADWCAVDMQEPDGSFDGWPSPTPTPPRCSWPANYSAVSPRPRTPTASSRCCARGRRSGWRDPGLPSGGVSTRTRTLRILRALGPKSYICVPLRSRAGTLGALTFVTAESGRTYDATSLAAAEDLAQRAVIAIENARFCRRSRSPTGARTSSWRSWPTNCAIRWPRSATRCTSARAKGPAVPELQWAREVIDRQVRQMTRLVDDLLDVSRITTGKIELRKERVD